MAAQKSQRRSRKRHSPGHARHTGPPPGRQQRAAGGVETGQRPAGVGERPASPFGGLPVSEIAIFAGAVGLIVGLVQGGGPALIVGLIVCALGVVEVTAREHLSGFRSHSVLLAGIPAVGVEAGLVAAVHEPRLRGLLLLAVVPVFATCFWLLRKRFQIARQARLVRRPAR